MKEVIVMVIARTSRRVKGALVGVNGALFVFGLLVLVLLVDELGLFAEFIREFKAAAIFGVTKDIFGDSVIAVE